MATAHDEHRLHATRAAAVASTATGGRRKGSTIRAWLVVSDTGRSYLEEVGKHSIMRRTGLPARDLRILDPLLSYPSTILGRERAIVINLEHIKAVITATEVLVPNSKDPIVAPFIHDLRRRVSTVTDGANQPVDLKILFLVFLNNADDAVLLQEAGNFGVDGEDVGNDAWFSSPLDECGGVEGGEKMNPQEQDEAVRTSAASHSDVEDGTHRSDLHVTKDGGPKVLPFEFKVLEACLEFACRCLESETLTLEEEAYPALDELTSKISTLNLERVRQIKSRLVAISGRVQKARDELEHLLDDDRDMAEMYLTAKLVSQSVGETSSRFDVEENSPELGEKRNEEFENGSESSNGSLGDFKPDIQELEMLLEAYFVQIDGTLNKLSTLREYVDDTEDYINIMLDEKQNKLLEMGVMLSTATLVCSAGIVVVSIFGMNITINLFSIKTYTVFWQTTLGTIVGCLILYFMAIGWGKKSGLLQ